MHALVDATFQEADVNKDGKISFEEYAAMVDNILNDKLLTCQVKKHPTIIDNMSISSSVLQSSAAPAQE